MSLYFFYHHVACHLAWCRMSKLRKAHVTMSNLGVNGHHSLGLDSPGRVSREFWPYLTAKFSRVYGDICQKLVSFFISCSPARLVLTIFLTLTDVAAIKLGQVDNISGHTFIVNCYGRRAQLGIHEDAPLTTKLEEDQLQKPQNVVRSCIYNVNMIFSGPLCY